jgi:arylsulfatase A
LNWYPVILGLGLAFPLHLWSAQPTPAELNPPPNIVIIYADDVGFGDLGCYGASLVTTPNIDRLAREGVRFTDAHATAATCTPSRYSILTGRYAFREPRAQILPADAPLLIPPHSATVSSLLQKKGYATGYVGKWHLGLGAGQMNWNKRIVPGPLDVGFGQSFIIAATPDRVPCVYIEGNRVVGLDARDPLIASYERKVGNEPTGQDHPELLRYAAGPEHQGTIVDHISRIGWMAGSHSAWWTDEDMADRLTSRAVDFIVENQKRPFFLFLSLNDVHVPRAPNARFIGTSRCGIRGDALEEMDWCVGQVMEALRRSGLQRRTLVIFSSDNGPILRDGYDDGSLSDAHGHHPAGPFRGGKYQIYEGGTRLPLIANLPGVTRPGVSDALISQVDFLASLAHLACVTVPAGAAPDSIDLSAQLLGQGGAGRADLVEEAELNLALRHGKWKYIPPGKRHVQAQLEDSDLSAGPQLPEIAQLYDLSQDPGETHNRAGDYPSVVRDLADRLQAAIR